MYFIARVVYIWLRGIRQLCVCVLRLNRWGMRAIVCLVCVEARGYKALKMSGSIRCVECTLWERLFWEQFLLPVHLITFGFWFSHDFVVIYSTSCHSKHVYYSFLSGTQKKIFKEMSWWVFLCILWKANGASVLQLEREPSYRDNVKTAETSGTRDSFGKAPLRLPHSSLERSVSARLLQIVMIYGSAELCPGNTATVSPCFSHSGWTATLSRWTWHLEIWCPCLPHSLPRACPTNLTMRR